MIGWLLLAACSNTYTLEATIEDAMGAGPLGGFDVIAKADDPDITLSCRTKQGTATDEGVLRIAEMCPGTAYTLHVRADVVVPELEHVADGGPGGPITVKGYQAPAGEGPYLLSKGDLSPLPTSADLKEALPKGASDPVYFPKSLPDRVPLVAHGDHLLLAGEGMTLRIEPLVAHDAPVELEEGAPLPPRPYAGVAFEGGTPVARTVAPDAAHVTEITVEGRSFRYLAAKALPEGRYALYRPGERRMALVDMGAAPPPAVP